MKTATMIETQTERKKAEKNTRLGSQNSASVSAKYDHRQDAERLKPFHFRPGQSGNPGGRPRVDVASEIAQAIFLDNPELIYEAFLRVLKKGSPFGFQVLADRAFGRLKEVHALEFSPYKDVSDEDLNKRVRELEDKLGVPHSTPELLPPADDKSKPN